MENELISQLILNLKNQICYFPIYLGKMGFPATINNFKEEQNCESIQLNKEYTNLKF